MKRLFIAGLFGLSLLLLNSCGKQDRVEELKDFVEKVQKEGSSYTEKKWEEVNEEFSELLQKLNSYEDLSAGASMPLPSLRNMLARPWKPNF